MDNEKKKIELQKKISILQKKESKLKEEIKKIEEIEKLAKRESINKMKGRTFMGGCDKFLIINGVDAWDGDISATLFEFDFKSWLVDLAITAPSYKSIKEIKILGFKEISRTKFFETLKKKSNKLINTYKK